MRPQRDRYCNGDGKDGHPGQPHLHRFADRQPPPDQRSRHEHRSKHVKDNVWAAAIHCVSAAVSARPNNRKKFPVVLSASASSFSPRSSATKAAVSATNAGSQGFPRCGTGARNGESVSTNIWSRGSHLAVSWRSWAFLNVTIPDKET